MFANMIGTISMLVFFCAAVYMLLTAVLEKRSVVYCGLCVVLVGVSFTGTYLFGRGYERAWQQEYYENHQPMPWAADCGSYRPTFTTDVENMVVTVNFTATANSRSTIYFGDGQFSGWSNSQDTPPFPVTHTYNHPGLYSVIIIEKDSRTGCRYVYGGEIVVP